MALQPAPVITIPIVGGLEEGTDDKLVARLKELKNGYYRKRGGIAKRFGTTLVYSDQANDVPFGDEHDAAFPPNPDRLFVHRDETLRTGGHKTHALTSRVPGSSQRWVYRGRVSPCAVTLRPTLSSAVLTPDGGLATKWGVKSIDSAMTTGGHVCLIFQADAKVWFQVYDSVTGTLIDSVDFISGATNTFAKVTAVGTKFVVAAQGVTTNTIDFYVFDTTVLGASWAVVPATITVATAFSAGPPILYPQFDLASDGTDIFVAYGHSAGNNLKLSKITLAGVVTTYTEALAVAATGAKCALSVVNGVAWVAAIVPNSGYIRGFLVTTSTMLSVFGGATIDSYAGTDHHHTVGIVGNAAGTEAYVCWASHTIGGATSILHRSGLEWNVITSGGALRYGTAGFAANVGPISKPFVQNGQAYVVAHYHSVLPTTGTFAVLPGAAYLLDLNATDTTITIGQRPRVAATWRPRQLGNLGPFRIGPLATSDSDDQHAPMDNLCNVYSPSTGKWALMMAGASQAVGANQHRCSAIDYVTLDFSHKRTSATNGPNTFLSGGVPTVYDGASTCELGFHYYPDADRILAPTQSAISAGLSTGGLYHYKVVYSRRDSVGNVLRSAPSAPIDVTLTGSNNACTFLLPTLQLTLADEYNVSEVPQVFVELYRTTDNGSTFYRCALALVDNDTTAVVISVFDSTTDAALVYQPQLYTDGTALDNVSPPSATLTAMHKGRLWLAGTDDDTIWYSKFVVQGELPAFNEGLTIPPFDGGRVTALAALDDKLIIFKEDAIYVVFGDGPDDAGRDSTLSLPTKVASDTGCTEPRSVVSTDAGVFFRGARGIMLLGRGMQVQFVGEGVSDSTPTTSEITSATLIPERSHVVFSVRSNVEGTGSELIFDLLNQAWSRASYYDTVTSSYQAASFATYAGKFTYLTTSGTLYEENQATYLDAGSVWVTLEFQTADIKLSGALAGYARVWKAHLLGTRYEPHDFTFSAFPNYGATAYPARAYVTASFANGALKAELVPTLQTVDAIRFKYTDATASGYGTGRGTEVSGISLEYGVYPRGYRGNAATVKG